LQNVYFVQKVYSATVDDQPSAVLPYKYLNINR